jgi:hypothetical protein
MSFTADQIESIIAKLKILKETHTLEDKVFEEFNEFKLKNRLLYDMVFSLEGIDETIFKEMMRMKRRLENGEDQYSVDVRFGKYMAGKYIDPVVKK